MSACVPPRNNHTSRSSSPSRASGIKRPHSPPPAPGFPHIRNAHGYRGFPVYGATITGVTLFGVLEGATIGIAIAAAIAVATVVAIALHRLPRTRITVPEQERHHPAAGRSHSPTAQGDQVVFTGRPGGLIAEPAATAHSCCRPWTPWRNHHRAHAPDTPNTPGAPGAAPRLTGAQRLLSGLSSFQRTTAPLVREELARLASEGQRPSQLFITCADSRLVTSMITASGPGDLFTVRNVGNLVPPPDPTSPANGDDSVAAAIEYAVDVLEVESITVCGHSGCGAMQALLGAEPDGPRTPLRRWLRHGLPSLQRMRSRHHSWARISGRLPTDAVEQLCLTNVVQQLDHLRAHASVARRLTEGTLQLHGMYFHVGEAQAYLLTEGASSGTGPDEVFDRVDPALSLDPALNAAPGT